MTSLRTFWVRPYAWGYQRLDVHYYRLEVRESYGGYQWRIYLGSGLIAHGWVDSEDIAKTVAESFAADHFNGRKAA